jgi:glyceraldehyde-3-phosphate dehydrogenase/erythrose-4-phosphate dehydrogenase
VQRSSDADHHPKVRGTGRAIFDSGLAAVLEGSLVKVVSWYDNEWGYSSCCVVLGQRVPVHAHA